VQGTFRFSFGFGLRAFLGLLVVAGLAAGCGISPGESSPDEPAATIESYLESSLIDSPTLDPPADEAAANPTSPPALPVIPEVTETPEPTATPPPEPSTLTICTGSEPDTLFLYHGTSYMSRLILQAVYDGPIDSRGYGYQPVILDKFPSLADGDARVEAVAVSAGDWVVNAAGEVVELADGERVFPAGCRDEACAVTYAGQSLDMDRLSADFTISDDVTWSDGRPVTAGDSVFSYQTGLQTPSLFDPAITMASAGLHATRSNDPLPYTAAYEALDDRTVRWTGLPGTFDPFYRLNFFTPLPQHRLGEYASEHLPEVEEAARLPMGWGPYILRQWIPGERIVAERNPIYFRAPEGLPHFDRLVFRFYPGVQQTRYEALLAGQCDILTLDGLGFPYGEPFLDDLISRGDAGEIRYYPIQGAAQSAWEHLTFNLDPPPGSDRPAYFADVRTRQAIAHCLDRDRPANELAFGLPLIPDTFAPADHPLTAALTYPVYEFDPEKGRALLEEAGWVLESDEAEVRVARGVAGVADGTPLAPVMLTTYGNDLRMDMSRMFIEDLSACGIDLTVEFLVPAELFADAPEGPLNGRRFDLAQYAWLSAAAPDCRPYLSDEIPTEANGWRGNNVAGYNNPAFDAACLAALAVGPFDPDYRTHMLAALNLFVEDLPARPLMNRVTLAASRPDLAGLLIDPTQPLETWNIEAFRLED
jgi:peptide/nickel transport system substrate-binding protein